MKFQFLIFISILVFPLQAQIFLKAPEKKTFMYDKSEITYYEAWASHLRIENQIIKSKDSLIKELRFSVLNGAYWNRFNAFYKMIPNDANDILYPFFDGIEFDKDVFCYNYRTILREPKRDFIKRLTHYKKQLELMDTVCECIYKSYNPKLLKILDELEHNDQNLRNKFEKLPNAQKKLDSANLVIVLDLYERYGYLNRKLVGIEYEAHMFYIIQHSNLETMEKFLPIIHKEIELGRLTPEVYPLLHDRINMIKGFAARIWDPKYT